MARTRKTSTPKDLSTENARLQQRLVHLQDQLARQADLLNLARESMIVMDCSHAITFWNRGAELRYGWNADQARGQVMHTLLQTEFPQPLHAIQADLARQGYWEGELVHTTCAGKRIAVETRWELERDATGEPIAILDVHGDTTERQRAQKSLLEATRRIGQLNQELAQRAQGLENANEELEVTNEELRVANEDLSREILERKRAEELAQARSEELRVSEERFRFVLANSPVIVANLDRELRYTWVYNPAPGFKVEDALGKTAGLSTDPDTKEEMLRWLQDVVTNGTSSQREIAIQTAEGNKTFESHAEPLRDAKGKITGVAMVSVDITERQRAEEQVQRLNLELEQQVAELAGINDELTAEIKHRREVEAALREAEQKANDLIRYAPSAIYEIDIFGPRFTQINDAMCEMSGYTRQELLAMSPFDLLDEESQVRFRARMRQTLAGEPIDEAVEYKVKPKDEREMYVILKTRLLYEEGKPVGAFVIAHDITERKRAEEAVRRRTEELQAVMEAVPTAVFITRDPEARTITGNRAARELVELPDRANISKSAPEDERPTGWQEMRHGVPIAPQDLPLQQAVRGREVQDYEMDLVFREGTVKSIVGHATPLRDENGSPQGGVAVLIDVTQRKRIEDTLRWQHKIVDGINRILHQSLACETDEELGRACLTVLEEVTESKFGFVGELNANGKLINIAISDPGWDACRMPITPPGQRRVSMGFSVHGIYGRVVLDGKAFYTNDPASHPDRIGTPAGHPPLRAFLGVPLIQNGKTVGMIGLGNRDGGYRDEDREAVQALAPTVVQALQHKRAEESLRLSEAKFSKAFHGNSAAMSISRLHDGLILDANDRWLESFGYSRDQAIGKIVAAQSWLNPEAWVEMARELEKDGAFHNRELTWRTPEGKEQVSIASAQVVTLQGEQVLVASTVDITDRKRAEESLREAMLRIQQLNMDLEQRASDLRAANVELERLATSLALDLRSPLVSLRGVSSVLEQDYGAQLPSQARHLFGLIKANAEEMEGLTQGLLQLMRVTQQTLQKQELNPDEIVRAAWRELESQREGRSVELVVGDLPACRADPLLLKLVWVNLLSNALQATHQREPARVEVGAHLEGKRTVYFVKDNGVGFDMSYAGTIFRAFQRYHRPEEWEGEGVGLAIVDSVIRRHGGRVWAESALDQGATFCFEL